MKSSPLREAIFLNTAALGQSYQLVADLMQARVQAKGAEDRARMLQAWQLWFDAVFEDRNKAQLEMENQFDQLQSLAAALEQTQTPVTWRKNGARKFCAIRITFARF
ncbi:MAG TPA: hypothetical protein VJK31_11375 [Chthoniobacterales bacterium]|nr:hypothetical protein [Chthoniobacterales bacterium]